MDSKVAAYEDALRQLYPLLAPLTLLTTAVGVVLILAWS